jgi:hypothetical protein
MLRFASAVAAAVALLAPSAVAAERPPKVAEVDYHKASGDGGPATGLFVFFSREADAVKLKAGFEDDRAKATGRLETHIDTHRYGNPWEPDPKAGRRELLDVMKESIAETGAVTLTVVAENDSGKKSKTPVEIVFSECHQEPPLYPFTCVVEP